MRRDLGDAAGALSAYQEMLVLDREIAAANIGDTKRQRVVSVDLNKIADVKLRTTTPTARSPPSRRASTSPATSP